MVTFINNNDSPVIRHFNRPHPSYSPDTRGEQESPAPRRNFSPKDDATPEAAPQQTSESPVGNDTPAPQHHPHSRPPRVVVEEKVQSQEDEALRHRRRRPRRKKIINNEPESATTRESEESIANPVQQKDAPAAEETSQPALEGASETAETAASASHRPRSSNRRRTPRSRRNPKKQVPGDETAPAETADTEGTIDAPAEIVADVPAPETAAEQADDIPAEPEWHQDLFIVPEQEGKTRFHDLSLPPTVMHSIADLGWTYCTPIQADALPPTLAGRDCTGRAQTGTGKTAAFLLAILHRLIENPLTDSRADGHPRALIIAPTRELVQQIEQDAIKLCSHSKIHMVSVYGGASYIKQKDDIESAPLDIVIATPGRLIDLCRNKVLNLQQVEMMIIDEADRMLDMGFIPDVRRIVRMTPPRNRRQTLLFSATLSPEVLRLAEHWLENPVSIEVEPESVAVKSVEQHMYIVENNRKMSLLYHILSVEKPERAIIFANRRDQVFNLCVTLKELGINCDMISGALTQNKREKTLHRFKDGSTTVLVATDVAGRGLHVDAISHVINYNLPTDPEDYVHRIGRTGRAGALGKSISFACEEDSFYIPDIEEYLGEEIKCERPDDSWFPELPKIKKRKKVYGQTGDSSRSGSKRGRSSSRRPQQRAPRQKSSNAPAKDNNDAQ